MNWRHELKFEVPILTAQALQKRLQGVLSPDVHAGADGYDIRSLYFDDLADSAFAEKVEGVESRCKYRMRIYNRSDSIIHLECKQKQGAYVGKRRAAMDRTQAERLLASHFMPETDDALVREFALKRIHGGLRPAQIVDYHRQAFVCAAGNVRITFDSRVSAPLSKDLFCFTGVRVPAMDALWQIIEIKYDAFLPEYIAQAIQTDLRRPQALSKYTLCRIAAKRGGNL